MEYERVIQEYSLLGHMEKIDDCRVKENLNQYFLPHHAVVKPDSTSTKVRVVFNASFRSTNGKSLNDMLYAGPVLQSDLMMLILRWRLFKYVFTGDIEKMYRQIWVDRKHTGYQKILFRDAESREMADYELKTVTFGINCAPFLAIRTLIQLADDTQGKYPLAAEILRTMMYVDDALVGTHDLDTAIKARKELVLALAFAGFVMKKWTSNTREILKDLPKDNLMNKDFLEIEDLSMAKTLGIRWNARSDMFYFAVAPIQIRDKFTKREVLSIIAKLFDPAGWLAPIVVIAKILMQDIWLEKTEWDGSLSNNTLAKWKKFLKDYCNIGNIEIPRWVNFSPGDAFELHAFADASEKAYGTCLYVRVKKTDGTIDVNLLCAKSRVAPVKKVSLPKLELCAAVLLADMVQIVNQQCIRDMGSKIFCWSDSSIVLAWLNKPAWVWSTFVSNRVARISEKVGNECWSHVRSEDNPADLVSRGVPPQDLVHNSLWWHGPAWLQLEESIWPSLKPVKDFETELEIKPVKSLYINIETFEDILDRFSSYEKSLRVMAYVFRFVGRIRKNNDDRYKSVEIYSNELKDVKSKLIGVCQKAHFGAEYEQLSKKIKLNTKSKILTLNPFLDGNGILRVGGRLADAPSLTFDEKFPILLPYNCSLSRLLVRFIHTISLHGGNTLVLSLLRNQFWIPKAKNLIRTTIRSCKPCVLLRKKQQTQLMAALPPERTSLSHPFLSTGVDFAGPFDIKSFSGRGCRTSKGYVCLFVCFATKAIHLEAVSDLTTQTFLAAFARFVGRRGCPRKMFSDNGTNFVGASKAIHQDFKELLLAARSKVSSQYSHYNIEWHFNPAGAPHMGGLWESGVKSFKHHFHRTVGGMKYTFEELSTLLSRIESCLNSRPLGPMSEDPDDLSPLTPGHFLIGCPLLTVPEPDILENPLSLVNRWRKVKAMYQHFCKRWKMEYLKELHKRYKWKFPKDNVKVNDLVVVREEGLPPNEWRLGRVMKVFFGRDERVRVVKIRTARGIITRPIAKLVVLPQC